MVLSKEPVIISLRPAARHQHQKPLNSTISTQTNLETPSIIRFTLASYSNLPVIYRLKSRTDVQDSLLTCPAIRWLMAQKCGQSTTQGTLATRRLDK